MKLLTDEDSSGTIFVRKLRENGIDVITVLEAGLGAETDAIIFEYAQVQQRAIVTRNVSDFRYLHQMSSRHCGILVEYQDADSTKNMTCDAIVSVIVQLSASGWDIRGEIVSLNAWNLE